jgi:hypothetical protein
MKILPPPSYLVLPGLGSIFVNRRTPGKTTRVTMAKSENGVTVEGGDISLKRAECLILKLNTPKGG